MPPFCLICDETFYEYTVWSVAMHLKCIHNYGHDSALVIANNMFYRERFHEANVQRFHHRQKEIQNLRNENSYMLRKIITKNKENQNLLNRVQDLEKKVTNFENEQKHERNLQVEFKKELKLKVYLMYSSSRSWILPIKLAF